MPSAEVLAGAFIGGFVVLLSAIIACVFCIRDDPAPNDPDALTADRNVRRHLLHARGQHDRLRDTEPSTARRGGGPVPFDAVALGSTTPRPVNPLSGAAAAVGGAALDPPSPRALADAVTALGGRAGRSARDSKAVAARVAAHVQEAVQLQRARMAFAAGPAVAPASATVAPASASASTASAEIVLSRQSHSSKSKSKSKHSQSKSKSKTKTKSTSNSQYAHSPIPHRHSGRTGNGDPHSSEHVSPHTSTGAIELTALQRAVTADTDDGVDWKHSTTATGSPFPPPVTATVTGVTGAVPPLQLPTTSTAAALLAPQRHRSRRRTTARSRRSRRRSTTTRISSDSESDSSSSAADANSRALFARRTGAAGGHTDPLHAVRRRHASVLALGARAAATGDPLPAMITTASARVPDVDLDAGADADELDRWVLGVADATAAASAATTARTPAAPDSVLTGASAVATGMIAPAAQLARPPPPRPGSRYRTAATSILADDSGAESPTDAKAVDRERALLRALATGLADGDDDDDGDAVLSSPVVSDSDDPTSNTHARRAAEELFLETDEATVAAARALIYHRFRDELEPAVPPLQTAASVLASRAALHTPVTEAAPDDPDDSPPHIELPYPLPPVLQRSELRRPVVAGRFG